MSRNFRWDDFASHLLHYANVIVTNINTKKYHGTSVRLNHPSTQYNSMTGTYKAHISQEFFRIYGLYMLLCGLT